MTTAMRPTGRSSGGAPSPTGLADVIDTILDKGLVVDAYVRVSLIGIEVVTVDARVVVASVDTYLRFAEAVNRLDVSHDKQGVPQLAGGMQESGAKRMTKGAVHGVFEAAGEALQRLADDGGGRARTRTAQPADEGGLT